MFGLQSLRDNKTNSTNTHTLVNMSISIYIIYTNMHIWIYTYIYVDKHIFMHVQIRTNWNFIKISWCSLHWDLQHGVSGIPKWRKAVYKTNLNGLSHSYWENYGKQMKHIYWKIKQASNLLLLIRQKCLQHRDIWFKKINYIPFTLEVVQDLIC